METVTYKTLIIGFVLLIAVVVCFIVAAAVRMGKKYRKVNNDLTEDRELIDLMSEEREQQRRIVKMLSNKKEKPRYTHLN